MRCRPTSACATGTAALGRVSNAHVEPATASGQPTVITFDPVSTTRLRLDLTSAHPKAPNGFVAISELEVPGVALH